MQVLFFKMIKKFLCLIKREKHPLKEQYNIVFYASGRSVCARCVSRCRATVDCRRRKPYSRDRGRSACAAGVRCCSPARQQRGDIGWSHAGLRGYQLLIALTFPFLWKEWLTHRTVRKYWKSLHSKNDAPKLRGMFSFSWTQVWKKPFFVE